PWPAPRRSWRHPRAGRRRRDRRRRWPPGCRRSSLAELGERKALSDAVAFPAYGVACGSSSSSVTLRTIYRKLSGALWRLQVVCDQSTAGVQPVPLVPCPALKETSRDLPQVREGGAI